MGKLLIARWFNPSRPKTCACSTARGAPAPCSRFSSALPGPTPNPSGSTPSDTHRSSRSAPAPLPRSQVNCARCGVAICVAQPPTEQLACGARPCTSRRAGLWLSQVRAGRPPRARASRIPRRDAWGRARALANHPCLCGDTHGTVGQSSAETRRPPPNTLRYAARRSSCSCAVGRARFSGRRARTGGGRTTRRTTR